MTNVIAVLRRAGNAPKPFILAVWIIAVVNLSIVIISGRAQYLSDYSLSPQQELPFEILMVILLFALAYMMLRAYFWGPHAGHYAYGWGIYIMFFGDTVYLLNAFRIIGDSATNLLLGFFGMLFFCVMYQVWKDNGQYFQR